MLANEKVGRDTTLFCCCVSKSTLPKMTLLLVAESQKQKKDLNKEQTFSDHRDKIES